MKTYHRDPLSLNIPLHLHCFFLRTLPRQHRRTPPAMATMRRPATLEAMMPAQWDILRAMMPAQLDIPATEERLIQQAGLTLG